jgi:fructose-1,6-bisphosphatase I
MEERNKTLIYYRNQNAFQYSSGELSRIINSIRLAAKVVNYKVNKSRAGWGRAKYSRWRPTKLDVYANEVFSNFD